MAAQYRGKVLFVFVYCREAHPYEGGDPRLPWLGDAADAFLPFTQTHSWGEREARAELFRRRAKLADRVLVDEEGDRSVQRLYGAPDNRNAVFVMDARWRVVFKGELATAAAAKPTLEAVISGREPPRTRWLPGILTPPQWNAGAGETPAPTPR
jgi:hypothetical protein